jgi:cell shape-determining protein MreD
VLAHLLCAILLTIFFVLQSAIFSQSPLLSGTADILLLFLIAWSLQEQVKNSWLWTVITGLIISLISAMPFFTPLIGYLGVVGFSKLLQQKVWRIPVLAMFLIVLVGTIFQQSVYILALQAAGAPITWLQSLDNVMLPSILLNMIFALPMYAIVTDLAGRIYPLEVEA